MKQLPITRVYRDYNGDSHFEEMLIAMNDAAEFGALSAIQPVKGSIFREVEPSYDAQGTCSPKKEGRFS